MDGDGELSELYELSGSLSFLLLPVLLVLPVERAGYTGGCGGDGGGGLVVVVVAGDGDGSPGSSSCVSCRIPFTETRSRYVPIRSQFYVTWVE